MKTKPFKVWVFNDIEPFETDEEYKNRMLKEPEYLEVSEVYV